MTLNVKSNGNDFFNISIKGVEMEINREALRKALFLSDTYRGGVPQVGDTVELTGSGWGDEKGLHVTVKGFEGENAYFDIVELVDDVLTNVEYEAYFTYGMDDYSVTLIS
jgi:hypothetical protein